MQLSAKQYLLLLLGVALLMLLPHLDVLPVNIMEARNLITAREMVTDGNWILTTINGEPRYEKPPLPTWLTAITGMLFGFKSLFAMRLPVVLVTLLLIVYFYKLNLRFGLSVKHAFNNGLILITSFYIYFSGRDNQWDMYTHAFMLASIYFLWKLLRRDGNSYTSAFWGGLLLGFSILSKGPVSAYALLLSFLIAYGIAYGYRLKKYKASALPITLYIMIGLVIGLSWPLYVRYADPATVQEVSAREAGRWAGYEAKPFYYYWSFFTQSGLWTLPSLAALLYPYMKKRVSNLQAYRFTFFWTIFSVVLLSLIPEKKSRYLLPVLIPLTMNTGFYIEYLWTRFTTGNLNEKRFANFSFGLIGIIGIAFPVVQYFVIKNNREQIMPLLWIASITLFLAGFYILRAMYRKDIQKGFYGLVALQVVVIVTVFPITKAFLSPIGQQSPGEIATIASAEKIIVFEFKGFTPEITWEFGQKTPTYNFIKDTILKQPGGRIGLLATEDIRDEVLQTFKGYVVESKGAIDLNAVPKGSKKYRERLARDFYIISN